MLRLALPVLVTNLLHVLVEHVDTWLAGNYLIEQGDAPMAAIGLVRYLMWFVFTLFTVLSIGAMALVARMVGGGNLPAARRATNQALSVGIILSLIFMFAGWYLVEPLVALLQLEGEAARLAVRYLLFVLPVLPAIMIEEVGVACLRGAGDMVSGLIAMVVVNIVNISVSSCLLLGAGPFPELGWSGLAIGTLCGRVVGAIVILVLLLRGRAGLGLSLAQLRPDWHLIRRMLRIGIPGGLDAVTVVSCHMWYVSIINQLGARAAAAHGVGVSIEALAYMPGAAFQAAAATMAGQFLGAQLPERAARSVLVALAAGTAFMTGVGVLFYFGSEPLAEFFLGARESSVVPGGPPAAHRGFHHAGAGHDHDPRRRIARRGRYPDSPAGYANGLSDDAYSAGLLFCPRRCHPGGSRLGNHRARLGRAGRLVRHGDRYLCALPADHPPLFARRLEAHRGVMAYCKARRRLGPASQTARRMANWKVSPP